MTTGAVAFEYTHEALAGLAKKAHKLEAWRGHGRDIAGRMHRSRFELGDWLAVGEALFGGPRAYREAESITGLARGTLYDLASTAVRIPASVRTEELSWSHHRAVANLEPNRARRGEWLELAKAGNLSVRELKAKIEAEAGRKEPAGDTVGLLIRIPAAARGALEALAGRRGVTVWGLVSDLVMRFLAAPETAAELKGIEAAAGEDGLSDEEAGEGL